jgi:hypothetical protein
MQPLRTRYLVKPRTRQIGDHDLGSGLRHSASHNGTNAAGCSAAHNHCYLTFEILSARAHVHLSISKRDQA